MIVIEFNDDAVSAALSRLSAGLSDLTDPMNDIGAALVRSTRDRIAAGVTPEGVPFAPRSQATLDHYAATGRTPKGGPLVMEDDLRTHIYHEYGPDYALVGSNAVQAAVMQFGARQGEFGAHIGKDKLGRDHFHHIPWGDIPARPFLGLSDQDRSDVTAELAEWLEESLRGGA